MALEITGFLDFVHTSILRTRNTTFWKSSVSVLKKGGDTYYVGLLV
jgi:hypothetical protein